MDSHLSSGFPDVTCQSSRFPGSDKVFYVNQLLVFAKTEHDNPFADTQVGFRCLWKRFRY